MARIIFFVRVLTWTAVCIALASALAAAEEVSIAEPVKILVLSIVIASGPVGGWILAIHRQAFPTAYEVLVPATVLCFAPIALAVLVRQPGWFVLAGLFWFFAGWYFAIGMWI